jgi:hypothetical protein
MFKNERDLRRHTLPEPVELGLTDIQRVAGGSPTLPLPPPRANSDLW